MKYNQEVVDNFLFEGRVLPSLLIIIHIKNTIFGINDIINVVIAHL